MPIPEKNTGKKPRESEEDKDEATTVALCDLAVALAREATEDGVASPAAGPDSSAATGEQAAAFRKLIKRRLHQKKDEVLYDALARTQALDARAGLMLKQALEEAAEATVIERAEGKRVEINAFVVPMVISTKKAKQLVQALAVYIFSKCSA